MSFKNLTGFLALLLSLSCAHSNTFLGHASSDYHDLLNRETREKRYYSLEKVLYLTTVTYETEELRKAYVEEYARKYKLTDTRKEALLQMELSDAAKYDTFFISHFATDKDTSKLSQSTQTWRLALSRNSDGTLVDPDRMENVSSSDPVVQYFHPYVTHWSKNYRVKFSRTTGASALELKMVGVAGDLSFDWQMGKN